MVTRVFFWSILNRFVKLKTQNKVIILVQEANSRFSNYLYPANIAELEPSTIAQLALNTVFAKSFLSKSYLIASDYTNLGLFEFRFFYWSFVCWAIGPLKLFLPLTVLSLTGAPVNYKLL
jgi:hypothetical protein